MKYILHRLLAVVVLGIDAACSAAEPAAFAMTAPVPYQVIQRVGFDPVAATKRGPGDAQGHADVAVLGDFAANAGKEIWEYHIVRLDGIGPDEGWKKLDVRSKAAIARVPAGGWYRLEVQARIDKVVTRRGSVEPIGVGEVFMVAGQSYATNCNDERLKVSDPAGRVAAKDTATGKWGIANDPQPAPDGSDGGSIWPPLGDALGKEFGVPIGFANVAVGATSSRQWMPNEKLHTRLIAAGKTLGNFRAVLWQQGESDVIEKTTTAKYVANLKAIRSAATDAWGAEVPWLLAKSTLHPTVYTNPEGEGNIRKAIDELTGRPGFVAGPDTDTLTGDNRGGPTSRRHFSALGQRRAADMWFGVLKQHLNTAKPIREPVSALKLMEPAWQSPTVNRESCILLQMEKDGPVTARLAFPAAEVLEIVTADRRYRYDIARDVKLSADGPMLTVTNVGPVEPIRAADLFPPKDAPNSYKHRVGHPEQNLLYRPGHWFHDRNVEVTYRRREAVVAAKDAAGSLPRTAARLKAGKPLTLGISGDSISTGLDSSASAKAEPYQPGYPDLVAAQLYATFGSDVTLKNRAVSGWSVANGVADLDKLLAEKPHLIVVAYGMNDVGRRDPKWFGEQTATIFERIRKADPEIEVILVSPMLGNSEWVHTPREMFALYRDELRKLTGPGVALADVTAVWELLLKHKHDLDLTGNGLNHPNDFGHRLYAQAVLATIAKAAKDQ